MADFIQGPFAAIVQNAAVTVHGSAQMEIAAVESVAATAEKTVAERAILTCLEEAGVAVVIILL